MKLIIIILLVLLIFSKNVFATLKINEIYPYPLSDENEWVELYNDESQIIDISQYQLLDLAGNKIKISTDSAPPFGFVLVTSSSILNNSGDTVYLYKCPEKQLIDYKTYPNTNPSISFGRFPDGNENWGICSPTREALNSSCVITITPTPNPIITPPSSTCPTQTPTPQPTPSPTPTETPTLTITPTLTPILTISTAIPNSTTAPTSIPQSYENIYISEAMVNPTIGEKEWVEIYNNNDFPVFLNNWFIDDLENAGSSPKIFSLEMNAKDYGIFDLTSSMFNNDGDNVRLLDFNKSLRNDFEYEKTEQGKTLGRTSFDSDSFCLQEPSKNFVNNSCIHPSPTPITPTPTVKIILSSTIKNIPSGMPITKANNFDVSIHRSVNYPTGVVQKNDNNGQILGASNKLIINNQNNKPFINLLSFLSFSYSLLTIVSILSKMKLLYGKNKNFYSSSLHSP